MPRDKPRKPKVALPKAPLIGPPRRVLGILTVIIACAIGWGIATLVQFGMTYDFDAFPKIFHAIFFGLGIVGMIAGAISEGTGHGAAFEFHETGNIVSTVVNSVIYAALLILWIISARPRKYKR
jgi:hypothetical protein